MPRRPLVDLRVAGIVAAGGIVGVGVRAAIVLPVEAGMPGLAITAVTLGVNVLGSFLLGIVVAKLPERPLLRAFLGTGVLGGFTTYSAFAVQTVDLSGGAPVLGLAFAIVAVLLGALAAAAGLRVGRHPAVVAPAGDAG